MNVETGYSFQIQAKMAEALEALQLFFKKFRSISKDNDDDGAFICKNKKKT